MTRTTALAPVLAEFIAAVNAFDETAIAATFADDALVRHRGTPEHSGLARASKRRTPGGTLARAHRELGERRGNYELPESSSEPSPLGS